MPDQVAPSALASTQPNPSQMHWTFLNGDFILPTFLMRQIMIFGRPAFGGLPSHQYSCGHLVLRPGAFCACGSRPGHSTQYSE
jgi:hypothetical protein